MMNRKILLILFIVTMIVVLLILLLTRRATLKQNDSSLPPFQNRENTMINPASKNCSDQGGVLSLKKRGDGGVYGLCMFEDDRACEEWAMMRRECPVGGVKTTGFDTEAQRYCAWIGGKTLAEPDARCTLPNGTICNTNELFNGTCVISTTQ